VKYLSPVFKGTQYLTSYLICLLLRCKRLPLLQADISPSELDEVRVRSTCPLCSHHKVLERLPDLPAAAMQLPASAAG
jgi:hypothetical protein